MRLFRRRPQGRHALGAPTVATAPVAPGWHPPPNGLLAAGWAEPVPVPQPTAPPAASAATGDDLLGSIADLISSGEAWNESLDERAAVPLAATSAQVVVHAPLPVVAPAPPTAPPAAAIPPTAYPAARPLTVAVLEVPAVAPVPQPVESRPPTHVVVPSPVSSGPPAPVPVPVALVPVQGGHRVELGFRDGSSTFLDPGSAQALALAELSELLTSRD